MIKEFLPYQEALDLESLGFEEPCFAGYSRVHKTLWFPASDNNAKQKPTTYKTKKHYLLAPLYQSAFRWLREKYDIQSSISHICKDSKIREYRYTIEFTFKDCRTSTCSIAEHQYNMFTYEEAELACLKKIISILNETRTN